MDKELYTVASHGHFSPPNVGNTFCILPYANGQMYTFGQCFRKDKDFGDFIHLPVYNASETEPHFQIFCSNRSFSVKCLQWEGCGTYLNGKRVPKFTPLKVGDHLDIVYLPHVTDLMTRTMYLEESCWLSRKLIQYFSKPKYPYVDSLDSPTACRFLFRNRSWEHPLSRNLSRPSQTLKATLENSLILSKIFGCLQIPQNPIVSNPPTSPAAMQISLILHEIFGHLSLPTLKICRLICKAWEEEATKLVKTQTIVQLLCSLSHNSTNFSLYTREMLGFAHPNWKLKIGHDLRPRNPFIFNSCTAEGVGQEKFLSDFNTFFNPTIRTFVLKRLHLALHTTTYFHAGTFLDKIFSTLCSESLEEFHLVLKLSLSYDTTNAKPWNANKVLASIINAPALKIFTLESTPVPKYDDDRDQEEKMKLLTRIAKMTKFVRSLQINSVELETNLLFLKEIVIPENYPNLREIKIGKINAEGLFLLRDLKEDSLKTIEINGFDKGCDVQSLNAVLTRHRNSLETVWLDVLPIWRHYFLPQLPLMKTEKIGIMQVPFPTPQLHRSKYY